MAVACALLALATVSAFGRAAFAEPPSRVVVLRSGSGPVAQEAANRLRAELLAAGFAVDTITLPAGEDPRSAVERAAREAGAFAAVIVSPSKGGTTADVWVTDRVTGKTSVRNVEVSGANAPADLAVRAVDLLQASLLEAKTPVRRPQPPPPPDVARFMERPWRPFFAGVVLEAAGGVLFATGGIGPAATPSLRLSYGWDSGVGIRLGMAGPAIGPALSSPHGRATVHEELASLEAFYAFETRSRLLPVFSLGSGLYHLQASGSPARPYVGASAEVWAAAASWGIGGGYRVAERVVLLLDARGFVTVPRPVVTLAGTELGSSGRPSILITLGVLASLL